MMVRPWPSMKVRTPVMVARGMEGRFLFFTFLSPLPPFSSSEPAVVWLLCPDRQDEGVKRRRRSCLLFELHLRPLPWACPTLLRSLLRETKKARKAVTEVMIRPISADIICQNVSHTESIVPLWCRPEARITVTTMMTMVRQRDNASASFWVHLTRICQISRTGMNKTRRSFWSACVLPFRRTDCTRRGTYSVDPL